MIAAARHPPVNDRIVATLLSKKLWNSTVAAASSDDKQLWKSVKVAGTTDVECAFCKQHQVEAVATTYGVAGDLIIQRR